MEDHQRGIIVCASPGHTVAGAFVAALSGGEVGGAGGAAIVRADNVYQLTVQMAQALPPQGGSSAELPYAAAIVAVDYFNRHEYDIFRLLREHCPDMETIAVANPEFASKARLGLIAGARRALANTEEVAMAAKELSAIAGASAVRTELAAKSESPGNMGSRGGGCVLDELCGLRETGETEKPGKTAKMGKAADETEPVRELLRFTPPPRRRPPQRRSGESQLQSDSMGEASDSVTHATGNYHPTNNTPTNKFVGGTQHSAGEAAERGGESQASDELLTPEEIAALLNGWDDDEQTSGHQSAGGPGEPTGGREL